MNGTISQLHKRGSTNKTSDQRPVVLLNSGYQLLNNIINERLNRIMEQTNMLELEQGGGRQGRSVTINMQKMQLSRMKPTDKESESIESRSTTETPSMQCRRQLSGTCRLQKRLQCNVAGSSLARDEYVSYKRR